MHKMVCSFDRQCDGCVAIPQEEMGKKTAISLFISGVVPQISKGESMEHTGNTLDLGPLIGKYFSRWVKSSIAVKSSLKANAHRCMRAAFIPVTTLGLTRFQSRSSAKVFSRDQR